MNGNSLHDWSGELLTIVLTAIAWAVYAVRKLIGMDQRIGVVECALLRVETEREEARRKVESLIVDVATIKSDLRSNTTNTTRILDILEERHK